MSLHLDRAQVLLSQGRYELAERELGLALAEMPQEPSLHALLAMCLAEQGRIPAALDEARHAVHLGPDDPFCHYALASVHESDHRPRDAEEAIREAIRLDPNDADHFGLLAAVLSQQSRWPEALKSAEQGLAVDADHGQCGHVRSLVLTKLGRREEAKAAVADALCRDPDDALAHANIGWARLHDGNYKEALNYFRESLRIDPTSDFARSGMVEALKARYFIYRWLLRYFLWMSSLSPRARWGVIIGLYVLFRAVKSVERQSPELAVFTRPLTVVYLAFFLMTWLGSSMFNVMLRLSRYGRYVLSEDQRSGSNWVLGLLAGSVVLVGAAIVTEAKVPLYVAGYFVAMMFPINAIYDEHRPRSRRALVLYSAGLAVIGAAGIAAGGIGSSAAGSLFAVFLIAWVGFSWFANWVSMRT